ncbi:MAG: helix-turn-helix transcriptional regulator [Rhodospirillaceae bacterium]|nr:helix-turn-helix transcriptional regulator [Rhodospirillaceae bacterium]
MTNEFALDLKVARRKAGLTQLACAHLLEVHPSKVSLLEHGKVMPTVREICTLSLIYGRSFESFFGTIFLEAHAALRSRLSTLPPCPKGWLGQFNRQNTLSHLSDRLADRNDLEHGTA